MYDLGDAPVATVTFKDRDEVVTDPTEVTFRLCSPAGVVTVKTTADPETANPSVGVHEYQLPTLDESGMWSVRAEGTGVLVSAVEMSFRVRETKFP